MSTRIENLLIQKGIKITDQRKIVAKVLSESKDHPDVEELYNRTQEYDKNISIATIYRTLKIFEECGIIEKHDFGDGRARYEEVDDDHHDHLIDLRTGKVIEFKSEEIEKLQEIIAKKLGYKLIDHRLELYGIPLDDEEK